ncbi:YppE family protein [Alkalicoccus urumqiensis]|uniref:DUF1798 domain-containing protein n=1 Tax=Alkalicoccus urumqiensis TaxID=1548213 RepID=A0A2P6MKS2_ALKUR|nr:YppE family protein [Alkalicoccus urumqiensis]PRO66853.1 DUF1798 domain-containing protein [Alkalicoccus urumqiensis]
MTTANKTLLEYTRKLKEHNEQAYTFFKKYRLGDSEADFHGDVKPFADAVREDLEIWVPEILRLLEKKKPAYLHPQQIDQLTENFEMLSVTCFQKDTKKKRFREQYQSIDYTLSMAEELADEDSK